VAMHLDRMSIHRDLDPCMDHTYSVMHIALHIAFIYPAVSIYKEGTEATLSHYGAQSTPVVLNFSRFCKYRSARSTNNILPALIHMDNESLNPDGSSYPWNPRRLALSISWSPAATELHDYPAASTVGKGSIAENI